MPIRSILLVDDEPAVRKLAKLSLQTLGRFHVFLAGSGPEAVRVAARERPDVIILDDAMPGVDGAATLDLLRANRATAGVPVIFFTESSKPHQVNGYLALGAVGVIRKPFEPMLLADLVRSCFSDVVEDRP